MYILHGSVATQLKCGGIFHNHVIANCQLSVEVKKFLKSANIWYEDLETSLVSRFYGSPCTVKIRAQ